LGGDAEMMRAFVTAFALLPAPSFADFTDNNLLAIFYHELGHAVIDQMQVPIFGQEEDAADTLSILMIDAFYEPDAAEDIAYDSAALFWAEAQNDPAYWDTHGPDEQRYFNTVCLFYGADPDGRAEFARELDLPEERAEGCEDEYVLASDSWNTVLDEMGSDAKLRGQLILKADVPMPIVNAEIVALNVEFKWPRDIVMNITACGEANAFYDLDEQSVTMCTEMTGWLDAIGQDLGLN
jgi:hypothetical protein